MEEVVIIAVCVVVVISAAFIASTMIRQRTKVQISALSKEKEMLERQLAESKDDMVLRLAEAREEAANQKDELRADFQRQMEEKEAACQKQLADMAAEYRRQTEVQSEQFKHQMELFRDQLKNDTQELLQKRQEELTKTGSSAMDAIVKPLNERLKEMREALDKTSTDNLRNSTDIQASIRQMFEHTNALGDKTDKLSEALRSKGKVQGDWGESILEEILQSSGMQAGIHYETQKNFQDDDGRNLRPDVIIHCPDNRDIIVDSKVSLTDYYNYTMASSDDEAQAAAKANCQSVRKHVEELSRKQYPALDGNLQKMMLMFIPNEGSYLLALRCDSNLLNWAYGKNVIIVNQTSLMLTLHLIDALWKNVNQEKNALRIFDLATLLYDRISDFTTEFHNIEKSLRNAEEAYSKARGKLSGNGGHNVFHALGDLKDLGNRKAKKQLDTDVTDEPDTPPSLT